jgi:CelD/BcsL family acetyltransferase involved in cellulose biosynthesis
MVVTCTLSRNPSDGREPGSISGPSAAEVSPRYSVERVTSEEGLWSLQEQWNQLSETAELPNVFTTFDWFRAWNQQANREHRSDRYKLNILVLRKDGAVAGIWPLVHRTVCRFGLTVRKLEFLESPADYNEALWQNDPGGQLEAVMTYLGEIQDRWDLIDLRNLRIAGNTKALIESALSKTDFRYRILPEARCPYLPIHTNAFGMMSLSRSARGKLRNKQHRLERMSAEGLRVRIIENPQDEPKLLEKLIALDSQKRIHGKLVSPLFTRYPEVFQFLFDTLGPRGWIYVALLELRDRPLALQLGFRCGNTLWDFYKAYDHSFWRLSPGTMLVLAVLDYGFARGYREYDFLRGEEPYKMTWSTGCHETSRLILWNRRWLSRTRAILYLDVKTTVYRVIGYRRP